MLPTLLLSGELSKPGSVWNKGFCSDVLLWTEDSDLAPSHDRHPGEWICLSNRSRLVSSGPATLFSTYSKQPIKTLSHSFIFGVLLHCLFMVMTSSWGRQSQQSQNEFRKQIKNLVE